jgi:hypothetical protein
LQPRAQVSSDEDDEDDDEATNLGTLTKRAPLRRSAATARVEPVGWRSLERP